MTNMLSTDIQVALPTHKEANFIKFYDNFKGLWMSNLLPLIRIFFYSVSKAKFLLLMSSHEVAKP